MDLTVLAVTIGALIFTGVFAIGYAFLGKSRNLQERVRHPGEEEKKPRYNWRDLLKSSEQLFKPLGEIIPRSPEEMTRQERRLVQAGIRRKDSPVLFYGIKLGLVIVLLGASAATGYLQKSPILYIVLSIFLGALLPDLWLTRSIRRRKQRIQFAIPDALDLTVVCVEAGLGLDQSLMRIGQEIRPIHPDFSDELRLLNLEINAGKSRVQALRNLSSRTEVDDLKALIAVLIQTDRFGTSVAQSLRVFSDSLRTKRRQRAEERAAKTTIKMIPPLVFFILPSIFVVVLGPAIIMMIKQFLPTLGE
ncbi:MAG: type II secretion system F family protein [Acidobacteriota bacterium]